MSVPPASLGVPPDLPGSTGQGDSFLDECWRCADPTGAGRARVSGAVTPNPVAPAADHPPIPTPPETVNPGQRADPRVNRTPADQASSASLPREPGGDPYPTQQHAGVPDEVQSWGEDAVDQYLERIGIAEDMGVPTDPGGLAEQVARREALRVASGWPVDRWPPGRDATRADDLIAHATRLFGPRSPADARRNDPEAALCGGPTP